ncbi:hypothetical protein JG688_00005848 [Phytophthora aleatoria]|uniref:Uncharacterized protein n=1 Tax=Phytophthora aleatoria TaxID=2496075 RepID=A0A8J5J1N6_9STRA|nr:hypothetical protein PI125_g9638 [Phytophthora idaei]KAG6968383.1 hypothetical protein JG688_00005848 [Phytophthora aleatoria]
MIQYVESIKGAEKLRDNYNPASWMLDVIGAGVSNTNGVKTDFVTVFKSSALHECLQSNLDREGRHRRCHLLNTATSVLQPSLRR